VLSSRTEARRAPRSSVAVALVLVVLLLGCAGAQPAPERGLAASLAGRFVNDGCLAQPQADGTTSYLKIAFDLTPTIFSVDLVTYADESCTTKIGTVHIDGPYTIHGPSPSVPGAHEGEFRFARRTVTPHVEGYIALMQSLSCGKPPYAVNEPQDIHVAGCPEMGLRPLAECAGEHDLVKLEGETLRFGKRPADGDLCTPDKRPTELSEIAFRRAP
jgi:hypothetical protein